MTWKKYTLEERKEIYSRPLEEQFVRVYEDGEAVVLRHLIRSTEAEDYGIVLEVAKALAGEKRGHVWILPEINKHETALRDALGLSTSNGYTPDLMMSIGSFVDVKSPESVDKISANACKSSRQGGVVCITDHSTILKENQIDRYSRWVLDSQGYLFEEAFFFINGQLYKRTKE